MTDDVNAVHSAMVLSDDVVNDVDVVVFAVAVVVDSFAFDKFVDHNQPDLVLTVVVISYVNSSHHRCLAVVIAWNIAIVFGTTVPMNSVAVATTIHCTWSDHACMPLVICFLCCATWGIGSGMSDPNSLTDSVADWLRSVADLIRRLL